MDRRRGQTNPVEYHRIGFWLGIWRIADCSLCAAAIEANSSSRYRVAETQRVITTKPHRRQEPPTRNLREIRRHYRPRLASFRLALSAVRWPLAG